MVWTDGEVPTTKATRTEEFADVKAVPAEFRACGGRLLACWEERSSTGLGEEGPDPNQSSTDGHKSTRSANATVTELELDWGLGRVFFVLTEGAVILIRRRCLLMGELSVVPGLAFRDAREKSSS
mmetsp:Transcript_7946/g.17233  ORF Transcript_7946/g.17233 Transcript_7946/m.17233 type:complete len:125 (-) Transcript_7946:396-770(-)